MIQYLVLAGFLLMASGCNVLPDWVGTESEEKLAGERITVLPGKSNLAPDATLEAVSVTLPPVAVNTIWLYPHFGQAYHLALATPLSKVRTRDVGDAPGDDTQRLMSTPIVAKDILYVLDGQGNIAARRMDDLDEVIWRADLRAEEFSEGMLWMEGGMEKQKFLGGQIAFGENILFATTVTGDVTAFDARRGYEIWQRSFKLPIKSPPMASGNTVFVMTLNNQFYALEATTGKTLWTHAGISETTGILGAPAPMVEGDVVIVPYSSGEIYALRKDSGTQLWGDSLAALRIQNTSLFSLNDIDATPVIYDGVVYSVGHEGILTATELSSSRRIWEQEISSVEAPWIAGDFLFILSTNDELICIYRPDGRIKWITPLPSYQDEEERRDKIIWNGPVVAGNQIFAVNSIGELWVFDPASGQKIHTLEVEEDIYLPPIVSNRKMYLLNNEAELITLE